MFDTGRKQRRAWVVESLESRELLSAAPTGISALGVKIVRTISGVVSGPSTFTSNLTGTTYTGVDTYDLSGKAGGKAVRLVGVDSYFSVPANVKTYHDSYINGSLVLSFSNGSTVNIAYAGSGSSPASGVGRYSATFHGSALFTSGPNAGSIFGFTDTLRGDELTDTTARVTETFKINI